MMLSADQMRRKLREACKEAGSQKAWAKQNGVSAAYVSDCLAGRREIGESISRKFGKVPTTVYISEKFADNVLRGDEEASEC
jgi:hypothetical protein